MKTLEELREIREKARRQVELRQEKPDCRRIIVCMDDCGLQSGAREVLRAAMEAVEKLELDEVAVMQQGCNGLTAFGSRYGNVSMICAVCALIKRAAAYCVTFFLRISTPLGSASFPSQTRVTFTFS